MKINLLWAIGLLFFHALSFGQNPVPNPGFEDWTDFQPDAWETSNSPGGNNTNVTRTTPGHTGEYALKGEVTVWPGTPGFPFIPLLESNTSDFGFPVDETYSAVSLYYKFHPVDPDDALTIFVGVLDENGTSFGGGFAEVFASVDTFTLLQIPITYGPGEPYRAFVSMTVNNYGSTGLPALGTYFIVDDISMGSIVSPVVDKSKPNASLENVFPNPARSEVNFSFSVLESDYVSAGIYDLNGRLVSRVFEGELHDGSYSMAADVNALNDGFYCLRLTTGSQTACRKFRVVKS